MTIKFSRMMLHVLLFSLLVSLFLLPAESFASTSDAKYTDDEITEIRDFLEELGVDTETQDQLITKLENGEIWDSMNPELIESLPEYYHTVNLDEPFKEYVFPDGSVYQLELTPIDLDKLQTATTCTGCNEETYYEFSRTSGTVSLTALADFKWYWNGGLNSEIYQIYSARARVIGGTATKPDITYVNKVHDRADNYAHGYISSQITQSQTSFTAELHLVLNGYTISVGTIGY